MKIKRKLEKVRVFKRVLTWKRKRDLKVAQAAVLMSVCVAQSLSQLNMIKSAPAITSEEKIKKSMAIGQCVTNTTTSCLKIFNKVVSGEP